MSSDKNMAKLEIKGMDRTGFCLISVVKQFLELQNLKYFYFLEPDVL